MTSESPTVSAPASASYFNGLVSLLAAAGERQGRRHALSTPSCSGRAAGRRDDTVLGVLRAADAADWDPACSALRRFPAL